MHKHALATIALSLICGAAHAQQSDCSQIENARERLACFDQQFPRDPDKPNIVPGVTRTAQAPETLNQPIASATPSTGEPPAPDEQQAAEPPRRRGIFDWPEKVEINSTIAGVRRENQKKMVFRLENGQIWLQSSPRDLPIREGDKVTIKSGTIGGFILRTENGTSTRVQRIE